MNPTPNEIVDAIRTEFFTRLEMYHDYVQDEVKLAFEMSVAYAMLKLIERTAQKGLHTEKLHDSTP